MSILLLGATRGLGWATYNEIKNRSGDSRVKVAGRRPSQKDLSGEFLPMDFSKADRWDDYLIQIKNCNAKQIIYFAGGGPFGAFHEKEFKDHLWALRVNFLFPAYLLHSVLAEPLPGLHQLCFVGSAVAENRADPWAASYAAAKHALKGLVASVVLENPPLDLRLFSPGYLDTDLLPPKAKPRHDGSVVESPRKAAKALWEWLKSSDADHHLIWP